MKLSMKSVFGLPYPVPKKPFEPSPKFVRMSLSILGWSVSNQDVATLTLWCFTIFDCTHCGSCVEVFFVYLDMFITCILVWGVQFFYEKCTSSGIFVIQNWFKLPPIVYINRKTPDPQSSPKIIGKPKGRCVVMWGIHWICIPGT